MRAQINSSVSSASLEALAPIYTAIGGMRVSCFDSCGFSLFSLTGGDISRSSPQTLPEALSLTDTSKNGAKEPHTTIRLQIPTDFIQHPASLLPECEVVMGIQGAGSITGPQLMADFGDVRRFTSKGSLLAFAGVEAPTFQS